ncbi:MAG: hypothetical protein ABSG41_27770, partial [Bryobacteraceae bacterium]
LRFACRLATARAKLAVRMDSLSPFLQGSFIPCSMPVYPGAPKLSAKGGGKRKVSASSDLADAG